MAVTREIHQHALVGLVFFKIPNRRHIRGAYAVIHGPVEQEIFRQIHGIIAAAAPERELLVVNPLELPFPLKQALLLRDRNQKVAIYELIEKRQIIDERDLAHDLIRIEAW